MTVKQVIEYLQKLPPEMEVRTFSPFDPEGPCEWVDPVFVVDKGILKICEDAYS